LLAAACAACGTEQPTSVTPDAGAGGAATGSGGQTGAGGQAGSGPGGSGGQAAGGAGGASGSAGRDAGAVDTRPLADGGGADRGGSGGSDAGRAGGDGAQPHITIWLAGDSTVATGGPACPIGWGGQFAPYFDNLVTVVNSAVAGRSVRTWLYSVQSVMDATGECVLDTDTSGQPVLQAHWQAMLDPTTGMKPGDYLFIQFGINDSDSTCPRHVGIAAFESSYGMMAQAAKDRGAQPIFLTPTSSISCSGNTARDSRGAFVPATKTAGTQYGVPVIDLDALTVALYNAMSFCPIPGGDVTASTTGPVGDFFCDDHTHFSASGAPQIAGLVAKAIRDQSFGLASYLK